MPDTVMSDREWILAARENDLPALIDGIKTLYNVQEVDVDEDGDISLVGQGGSYCWLDADGLARVARALRAGDI